MAETYVTAVTFGNDVITTTVTSSGQAVERWIAEILSVHRPGGIGYNIAVGLDVEWRPSYRADQNPVATLQLCVERSCLIFQLLHADYVPGALAEFLGDRGIRFFGVGVEADAERLSDDHGLQVANAVDLRGRAAERMNRPDLRQAGLRALVQAVMGVDLVKPQRVTMSRWDAYCLSYEQIRYACIDAFVSFEIARRLLDGEN
jgi:ribonuclease D